MSEWEQPQHEFFSTSAVIQGVKVKSNKQNLDGHDSALQLAWWIKFPFFTSFNLELNFTLHLFNFLAVKKHFPSLLSKTTVNLSKILAFLWATLVLPFCKRAPTTRTQIGQDSYVVNLSSGEKQLQKESSFSWNCCFFFLNITGCGSFLGHNSPSLKVKILANWLNKMTTLTACSSLSKPWQNALMSRICYRAKSLFSNGRFCPIKYSFIRVFNIPLENYTFPTPPTSLMSTWPQEFPIHKEKPASLDLNCFPKDRLGLSQALIGYHNSVSHPAKKILFCQNSCLISVGFEMKMSLL